MQLYFKKKRKFPEPWQMSIVQLFNLPLPDDLVRFIGEFITFSVGDLLALREVCKHHKEYIDRVAGGHLKSIKNILRSFGLDLGDPIYSDIRDFIPASGAFSLNDLRKLRNDHLERHLTLKNLSPEKLDRTFGFMLDYRCYYMSILPQVSVPDSADEIRQNILTLRKHFREYIMDNWITDTRFIHYIALSFEPKIEPARDRFAGLNDYQKDRGKYSVYEVNSAMKSVFGVIPQMLNLYRFSLLDDAEILNRFLQTALILGYSFFLDFNITYNTLKALFYFAFPSYDLISIIFSTILTLLICLFRSPTFNLMLRLDKCIYQIPSAHRFITDMMMLIGKYGYVILLLGHYLWRFAKNYLATKLVDYITST